MKAKLILGALIGVIAIYSIMQFNSEDAIASEPLSDVYLIENVKQNKGDKVHDFSFKNENGDDVYLSDLADGKVLFLNFWGTWCGPCRKEIPAIIELQNNYRDKGLVVVGVALERQGSPEQQSKQVSSFATKSKINYPNFIETSKREYGALFGGIRAVPTTFIVDKSGSVVETIQGGMSYANFEKLVKKYL